MGLDNGLIIKPKTEAARNFLREEFGSNREKYVSYEAYEFLYLRKCWNVRERVLDVFNLPNHDNAAINNMNFNQLKFFKDNVLEYFLNKDNWVYNDIESQVFSWEIELVSIAYAIRDITLFFEYLDEDLDESQFDIYFYDSY